MARNDDLGNVQRTRTGRLWLMLVPTLGFLILLIVFIAENGQGVEVKFFGTSGNISLALALLIAAVSGAVLVLLVGSARILQLRLATLRHRRTDARIARAQPSAVPADGDAQTVDAHHGADQTGP
jgi:uncharacterized integral membrane protein